MEITDILKTGGGDNTSEFTIAQNDGTIAFTIASVTVTIGGIVRFIEKPDKTIASFMIGDVEITNVVSTDAGKQ